jgi:hypothetical protein
MNHVAPRISELVTLVRMIATKRARITRSGNPAGVYMLPEHAD